MIQAEGKKGAFQIGSKVRATYQLSVKAGRGGRPGTWQNWEHPPPGQGTGDSTLFCPDSRYRRRIFLCSSPHHPTWRGESYVSPCLFRRESQPSRALVRPIGHWKVRCFVPWSETEVTRSRGTSLQCVYSTSRCTCRTKRLHVKLRYDSLFQGLPTIQIMGTI